MTQPAEPARCCGGQMSTIAGKPLFPACQLCPTSPTWWRLEPGAAARLAAADRGGVCPADSDG